MNRNPPRVGASLSYGDKSGVILGIIGPTGLPVQSLDMGVAAIVILDDGNVDLLYDLPNWGWEWRAHN